MAGRRDRLMSALLLAPALAVLGAFFLVPLGRLLAAGALSADAYAAVLGNGRYAASLAATVGLS
ncbi:hypothetical protein ACSTK0_24185, partial [Vibrio parahaemolyticus]